MIPNGYQLFQNYPNPFNPATTIQYVLPKAQVVEIAIFDVNGTQVRPLLNAQQEAGEHTLLWDGLDESQIRLPSGVYMYRLTGESETLTKKLTLLK